MTEIKPSEEDREIIRSWFCDFYDDQFTAHSTTVEHFAKMVATARMDERERCAVICDDQMGGYLGYDARESHIPRILADKIRSQS